MLFQNSFWAETITIQLRYSGASQCIQSVLPCLPELLLPSLLVRISELTCVRVIRASSESVSDTLCWWPLGWDDTAHIHTSSSLWAGLNWSCCHTDLCIITKRHINQSLFSMCTSKELSSLCRHYTLKEMQRLSIGRALDVFCWCVSFTESNPHLHHHTRSPVICSAKTRKSVMACVNSTSPSSFSYLWWVTYLPLLCFSS